MCFGVEGFWATFSFICCRVFSKCWSRVFGGQFGFCRAAIFTWWLWSFASSVSVFGFVFRLYAVP